MNMEIFIQKRDKKEDEEEICGAWVSYIYMDEERELKPIFSMVGWKTLCPMLLGRKCWIQVVSNMILIEEYLLIFYNLSFS